MLLALLDYCSDCVEIHPVPRSSTLGTKVKVGYCIEAIPLHPILVLIILMRQK